MALSEIFDKNAAHPWADIRFNNLTLDGALTLGNSTSDSGTLNVSFQGPFPATVFPINYQKIGKIVTLTFPDVQSTAMGGLNFANITSTNNVIPVNIAPIFVPGLSSYSYVVRVATTGSPQTAPGFIQLTNANSINIFYLLSGPVAPGFSNTMLRGMYSTSISYLTNG